MNLRSFFLILAGVLCSQASYPQIKHRVGTGIKFDVEAGVNLQSFYGYDFWGEKLVSQFQPGFHLGAGLIIPIIPDLYLQTGIFAHNKGSKQDTVAGSIKTASLYYAEMVISLLYRPQLGDGHLLVAIGPYAGYGLYGNENIKTGSHTDKLRVKFLNDASQESTSFSYYRPLDGGGQIIIGYELYSGVFFQAEGQVGILKINPGFGLANDKTSKKNIGFGFTAGYRF